MTFKEKLIQLRKQSGFTQEQLADRLGVSRQAISRWELGESTPDLTNLRNISELFHVSSDYLIHDDYLSEDDIPFIRDKTNEIIGVKNKYKKYHLVSAVCFFIATICICMAIINTQGTAQQIFVIWFTLSSATAVSQLYLYLKK
ncbi:MAG: helix-turn-helix transcriptional regulator [Erysipelotrichales bacterium]|nr:helix-turn-helix transcriptional regulator [Erysipelotrichales bacterium]